MINPIFRDKVINGLRDGIAKVTAVHTMSVKMAEQMVGDPMLEAVAQDVIAMLADTIAESEAHIDTIFETESMTEMDAAIAHIKKSAETCVAALEKIKEQLLRAAQN